MMDDRKEQPADLLSIGGGAALELFGSELQRVMENIRDPNTEAKGTRKITLEFLFKPNEHREMVSTLISAKSTLAASRPVSEVLWVGRKDGEVVGTVVHTTEALEDGNQHVLPMQKAGAS